MSYLATEMARILREREMKPIELSKSSGVTQSQISRLLNGQQVSIADEDFESISTVLGRDPKEQATLLAARMRDVCRGPAADRIKIQISGEDLIRETPPPYGIKFPPALEQAFAIIHSWVLEDDDVRDIIVGLANLKRTGDPATGKKLKRPGERKTLRLPGQNKASQ
jgi:transcriptional regulator with XRE-family HTH domain